MKFLFTLILCGLLVAPMAGQQSSSSASNCFAASEPAKCELEAGIDAYKNARYEGAIAHFGRAIQIDPSLSTAHLYLGTALANQYIPGADTPENNAYGERAIEELTLATREGGRTEQTALRGIASLQFQMKKFPEAKENFDKLTQMDAKDAEAFYGIGVIDWTQSYAARMKAYEKLGIQPPEGRMDAATCQQLAADHLSDVEQGIQMLTKALEVRPDYDDAMAYMNLLYRERADLQCSNEEARKKDLETADKWVDVTLTTKKKKMEQTGKPEAQRR